MRFSKHDPHWVSCKKIDNYEMNILEDFTLVDMNKVNGKDYGRDS